MKKAMTATEISKCQAEGKNVTLKWQQQKKKCCAKSIIFF
jgi:hypothetical protein